MSLNKIPIIIFNLCMISLLGCSEDRGASVVSEWNQASTEICDLLNSINNEESAKRAIPELTNLAEKFTQAKNEFLKYQKDNPGFEQKYLQESSNIMKNWGESLANFNTNQNISEETRNQIMKILSL